MIEKDTQGGCLKVGGKRLSPHGLLYPPQLIVVAPPPSPQPPLSRSGATCEPIKAIVNLMGHS